MIDETIVGKEAFSVEGKNLGKIIRVEGEPEATIISDQPRAIIEVERFLLESDKIHLPISKINGADESEVYFDIPVKEFRDLQKLYRYNRKKARKDLEKSRPVAASRPNM